MYEYHTYVAHHILYIEMRLYTCIRPKRGVFNFCTRKNNSSSPFPFALLIHPFRSSILSAPPSSYYLASKMDWTDQVPIAIKRAIDQKSPLLVLFELPSSSPPSSSETPAQLYTRLATRSLHTRLFSNPSIATLIHQTQTVLLRIPFDAQNDSFRAFAQFFTPPSQSPAIFLVRPTDGVVLLSDTGYLSPATFAPQLVAAAASLGCIVALPEIFLAPRSSSPSSPLSPNPSPTPPSPAPIAEAPQPRTSTAPLVLSPRSVDNILVKARLPDGRSIERRFDASQNFQSVRLWICEQASLREENITICEVFPRRWFDRACDAKLLRELQLAPAVVLVVMGETSRATSADGAPSVGQGQQELGMGGRAWVGLGRVGGIVAGFVRSFVVGGTPPHALERDEGERDGGEDNLRSNGNGTQFAFGGDQ